MSKVLSICDVCKREIYENEEHEPLYLWTPIPMEDRNVLCHTSCKRERSMKEIKEILDSVKKL